MATLPPRPTRPPPRAPARTDIEDEAAQRYERPGVSFGNCVALLTFEFTHTFDGRPGPVNRYLAAQTLKIWHQNLRQRRRVPILAPPKVAEALQDAVAAWPCSAAPSPRIVIFEVDDEYRELINHRVSDARWYGVGVAAAVCRALLQNDIEVHGDFETSPWYLGIVTHHHHAPRWAKLLEPTLKCNVLQPRPSSADAFCLWGLDADGYWARPENPQVWTHSAVQFCEYEIQRLKAFEQVGEREGQLFDLRTWEWFPPQALVPQQDVWALYDGQWLWASVASDSEEEPGQSLEHAPRKAGYRLRWVTPSSTGSKAKTKWRWPKQHIRLMKDEELQKAAEELLEAPDSDEEALRLTASGSESISEASDKTPSGSKVRRKSHWKPSQTPGPGWQMQRCLTCKYAVTGVEPQFCCSWCATNPGSHGSRCQQRSWRAFHRPRSLSAGATVGR